LACKCLWPVIAQIYGDLATFGGGTIAMSGQHLALELQHLRLVQFIDDGAVRPGQPVGARIETGGQNHHLAHTGVGGVAR
jgi:hypothetical protein